MRELEDIKYNKKKDTIYFKFIDDKSKYLSQDVNIKEYILDWGILYTFVYQDYDICMIMKINGLNKIFFHSHGTLDIMNEDIDEITKYINKSIKNKINKDEFESFIVMQLLTK